MSGLPVLAGQLLTRLTAGRTVCVAANASKVNAPNATSAAIAALTHRYDICRLTGQLFAPPTPLYLYNIH